MLTETINKIRGALGDPQAPWYGSDVVAWVGDLIEDAEKQKAELEQHRWIPVSERLPKDGKDYLVLINGVYVGLPRPADEFSVSITHWKPVILPKL